MRCYVRAKVRRVSVGAGRAEAGVGKPQEGSGGRGLGKGGGQQGSGGFEEGAAPVHFILATLICSFWQEQSSLQDARQAKELLEKVGRWLGNSWLPVSQWPGAGNAFWPHPAPQRPIDPGEDELGSRDQLVDGRQRRGEGREERKGRVEWLSFEVLWHSICTATGNPDQLAFGRNGREGTVWSG